MHVSSQNIDVGDIESYGTNILHNFSVLFFLWYFFFVALLVVELLSKYYAV